MSTAVAATATWHAKLDLSVRCDDQQRSVVLAAHVGPLRVLKTLYPEGPSIATGE